MLTNEMILKESGQYDKEIIQRLRVSNQHIMRISNLDTCVNLIELCLSYNSIISISGLDNLASLKKLDLSHNKLTKIENLRCLGGELRILDLQSNQIEKLSEISSLTNVPMLTHLFLKNTEQGDVIQNPVINEETYFRTVLSALPMLEIFDGSLISIHKSFKKIDDMMTNLKPNDEANTSPPPEPWFDVDEIMADDSAASSSKASKGKKSSKSSSDAISSCLDTHNVLLDMINNESSHLIRKAQTAISAAEARR